ncbi:hypothetical protein PR202_gb14221 [Eleusine coracana subsp. coracana]|uniref:SPRY domain-containing protein n=1 Tax=Eleusine coracana subsp. coracana TaxID=191504 RepID=A0AAV5EUX2_ELECO|nr:hypothetical protein PR202_gb14221 [Eleusine coracana subsp. coracana]
MASPDDEAAEPPSKRPRRDPQAEVSHINIAAVFFFRLRFDVGGGGLHGSALHEGGFAYCWSGARAVVGIRGGGKYCFGCKVIAEQPVEMEDTDAGQRHLCRIGVSRGDDPVGALGESDRSFGFGGTGKFSHQRRFTDYGVKFGVGDTVVCAVDLDSKPMASIGFARNGEWLGVAKHFDAGEKGLSLVDAPMRPVQWESAIFPHVLLKNVVVEMQFSREDGLKPVDGYEPWASAYADENAVFGPVFEQSECEVMMMVGLPASGKSTWAEKWVKEHPDKRFILLGMNLALDQMKVSTRSNTIVFFCFVLLHFITALIFAAGARLLRKNNYGERFDRLMDHATTIFNTLLTRAANIPRNYIIDQTNVYKSARIRKLRPFSNYHKTAVVVFPQPSELKSRAAKRFSEMGKEVPAEAVNEMTANFVLPLTKDMTGSKEPFDEVVFVELSRDDAQRNLDEMKRMLPRTLAPSYGNFNSQNATSTCAGTVSSVDRAGSSMPGSHPPIDNSYSSCAVPGSAATYGSGAHTPVNMMHQQAPWGVQSFQSPTGNQCQIYSGYPSAPGQYQMPSSYPSNPNQYQVHASYQSTPLPGYGQSTYGSYGSPSPQSTYGSYGSPSPQSTYGSYGSPSPQGTYGSYGSPSPYYPSSTERQQSVQAPISGRSLFQTPGSSEAYGGSGYAATNLIGRPRQVHPSTLLTYGSYPVDQQVAYQGSSDNYRPYGQHSHGR